MLGVFLVIVSLSTFYYSDGRSYENTLIRGFPFPYFVEVGGECEKYNLETNSCMDENTTSFYPLLLTLNIVLSLLVTVISVKIAEKLFEKQNSQ